MTNNIHLVTGARALPQGLVGPNLTVAIDVLYDLGQVTSFTVPQCHHMQNGDWNAIWAGTVVREQSDPWRRDTSPMYSCRILSPGLLGRAVLSWDGYTKQWLPLLNSSSQSFAMRAGFSTYSVKEARFQTD